MNENAYSSSLKGRESEFLYAPVSAETMPTETAKKVMNTLTKLTNGNVNIVLTAADMRTADGQTASGVFANGILYLSANATAYDQAMIVGSHELIHMLEGTKEYHALGDFITETIKGDPELQKKYDVNRYVAAYANVQSENYSTETKQYEALTEMYADFIANEILTNENTVQRLVNRNRNVVVRMFDWVRSAVKRLGMTKDDRAAYDAMRKWEKLLSSALNAGKGGISLDEVEERVQVNKQAETQEKPAEISSTGKLSDARYSIDEKFADRIDKWDEKTVGFSFVVGKTSEALKSIGVAEHQIRWDATKVRKVLSDHSMMSKEVIKQVPQVIENPIVIMDSKQIKDRLVVLGDVYDKHGDIVTVILELNPTRRNIKGDSAYLDIIKIASAQGRSNTQGLINGSNIRYIDKNKNRVNEWLKVNRLQLPLLSTTIDSTNSISEKNEEVNSFDKNSSKNSDERFFIDVDNFDPLLYNEIQLPSQEHNRLWSETMKWDEKKRNVLTSRTLSNGYTYRYILDSNDELHVYEKEKLINIHERGNEYDKQNREKLNTAVQGVWAEQAKNNRDNNLEPNGRNSGTVDTGNNRPVRSKGRGDGGRYSKNVNDVDLHQERKGTVYYDSENARYSLDVNLDQKTTGRVQTVVNDRKRSVKEVWDETLDNLKTGSADRWIRAQISLTDEQAGIVQAGKKYRRKI